MSIGSDSVPVSTAEGGRAPVQAVGQAKARPDTPFNQVPVVVVAKVREQRIVEDLNDHFESSTPPKVHQEYRLIRSAVRANKRGASEPDLTRRLDFILRQTVEVPLHLEFGREYVLFLKLSDKARWGGDVPPSYEVALPDIGFELGDETVRVLRRGEALAAYDGRPSEEVLRLIDPRYVDEVWRPTHRRR
jgi:hypothetical protein